jgi:hypothetical protein
MNDQADDFPILAADVSFDPTEMGTSTIGYRFGYRDAVLVGVCRRCGDPVDHRHPDPASLDDCGHLRIGVAPIPGTDGRVRFHPICDGCLREHGPRFTG